MLLNKDLRLVAQHCLLAVLFITPFVFIPIGEYNDFFYMPKVIFYTIIVCFFIVIALFNLKQAISLIAVDKINGLLLLLAILFSCSTIFAIDPELALTGSFRRVEGLSTLLTYFALFMMARIAYPLKQKHFNTLMMVASIIALYGIAQTFNLDPFPRDSIRVGWLRAFSTIGNPNFLGSYLVLMLPFATDQYIRLNRRYALLIYGILLYALLATMTRGAWIGAGLSHVVYAGVLHLQGKLNKSKAIIFVLVTLGVFVLYNATSTGAFLARFLSIGKDIVAVTDESLIDKAGSSRMFIWIRAGKLALHYPILGVGIENLGLAFQQFYSQDIIQHFGRMVIPDKAHNEYLHIAVTSGILSLGVYLTLLFSIIKKGFDQITEDPMKLALVVAAAGYAIQAFFNISVVSVVYVFWIFLGLLVNGSPKKPSSLHTNNKKNEQSTKAN